MNIFSVCSQTVYEIFYKTFLLLASNLTSIRNILQIKMGEQAYLFGTNLYRLIFTCFNFRSVRTVPKNKPSISCTRFIFIHTCLLKAAPLTQTQAQFNEISHLLLLGGGGVWPATSPDLLSPPTPWHTQAASLELQQAVTASHCSPCGPIRSAPPSATTPGTRAPPVGTKPQIQAQV